MTRGAGYGELLGIEDAPNRLDDRHDSDGAHSHTEPLLGLREQHVRLAKLFRIAGFGDEDSV